VSDGHDGEGAHPHRRYDPLLGRWVLVSAGRTDRPWQGAQEVGPPDDRPVYDPSCYLCPGNERANGERNPAYATTFAFVNDFSALRPDTPAREHAPHPLLRSRTQPGLCRVLCFSPRHDLALSRMGTVDLRRVVDLWAAQVDELGARYRWVQVFENRGAAMGASNPHPHGQVWASAELPEEPAREDARQRDHLERSGEPLLCAYAALEHARGERVVEADEHWLAVVPYWAVWPFETLVLPRRHRRRLTDLDDAERDGLARLLRRLLARYDNLFTTAFPYSMGWHGAPGRGGGDHWQLHAHIYPPLLRSASVRKFVAGYELLADLQRDLTAEDAAARLRACSPVHHREQAPPR
jgi:UDPglucose--hexose-1-phosphate uridylyltransferase